MLTPNALNLRLFKVVGNFSGAEKRVVGCFIGASLHVNHYWYLYGN